MATALFKSNRKARWFGFLAGIALVGLVGQLCLLRIGGGLARLSYDLPFLFSSRSVPNDLVMVYVDAKIKSKLGQPTGEPLNRRFYTRLLEKLSSDGARLVLFDILFDYPDPNASVDAEFAESIRKYGRVVLVGDETSQVQGDFLTSSPMAPVPALVQAAAGWGLAKVSRDSDLTVRKLDSGTHDFPSASWVAATLLDAPVTRSKNSRLKERWLNYYCPPEDLDAVNLDHALDAGGLSAGFFRDKIVVVGGRAGEVGVAGAASDEFATPYSRSFRILYSPSPAKMRGPIEQMAAGASIHAFSLLNLIHGNWMSRLGSARESLIVWFWAIVVTLGLMRCRPWPAMAVAVSAACAFAMLAICAHLFLRVWFAWLAPAAVQTSVALIWSVGFQYTVESRRRKKLRQAFAVYYSPYMADRIAESDFDLSLGGKEVEATVMFTDLEGFTAMSEALPPSEVSQLLTEYFSETTRAIFEQDGMIIKYIGDSVMAVWGVPLVDPQPAERAVLAAIGIRNSTPREFRGRRLRTRVGINTGKVLAGNLGSEFRFDYTLIGEATNFASRLEGLNKYLGTELLISESTQRELSDAIQCRSLGRFIVAGKTRAEVVYEVLGAAVEYQPPPEWLKLFDRSLDHFSKRELDECERLLREVLDLRGGNDGPAGFYLKEIEKARSQPPIDQAWDGVVILAAK
jgi:adenylate cyclase